MLAYSYAIQWQKTQVFETEMARKFKLPRAVDMKLPTDDQV